VNVTWNDARAFCDWLSRKEGRAYGLPTEAEWEYACRAGATAAYSFGGDPGALGLHAWFADNSGGRTHPVGAREANAWGLYDMHGNVWQWCADGPREYPGGTATDPEGEGGGAFRVLRGGSWASDAALCRAAFRHWDRAESRCNDVGFRVLLRDTPSGPVSPLT
jgi:formylglycine-generating enzyme required for sulfatase activity